jgi:hypothetical protein
MLRSKKSKAKNQVFSINLGYPLPEAPPKRKREKRIAFDSYMYTDAISISDR